MDRPEDHIQVIAGQLVAQSMLTQVLMGQLVFLSADRGAGVRKTLEDMLDILDRMRAAMPGR